MKHRGFSGVVKFSAIATIAALFVTPLLPVTAASAATKKSQKITWAGFSQIDVSGDSLKLKAKASSGLALKVTNATPEVCKATVTTVSPISVGVCKLTFKQAGTAKYKPAKLSVTFAVVQRATADKPDTVDGWQIHPIYVQPADQPDRQLDTNGYIARLLNEGNAFLKAELGQSFAIDATDLAPDVTYLKSSYSTDELAALKPTQLPALMKQLNPFANPGTNRKNYVFFVDIPNLNADYCGWADRPGLAAVVALDIKNSSNCNGSGHGLAHYAAKTWVHEVFHNLGVMHNTISCDLMYAGDQSCRGDFTIDSERRLYIGASAGGVNVLTLRVWKGYTQRTDLRADCFVKLLDYLNDGQGPVVYCPTGTMPIASVFCYSNLNEVELEQLVNGEWRELGKGYTYSRPWGPSVDFECSDASYPRGPWFEVTVTTPQINTYRWKLNDRAKEPFTVIFVR